MTYDQPPLIFNQAGLRQELTGVLECIGVL